MIDLCMERFLFGVYSQNMSKTATARFWDAPPHVDPAAALARTVSIGFVAGVLAMLLFHQGTTFILHHAGNDLPILHAVFGRTPAPYRLSPTPPFGLQGVLATALWGGAWGVALAAVLRRPGRVPELLFGLCFGAILPTFAELTVVAAAQDLPAFAGGDRRVWWRAGLANAAWGWSAALMILLALPRRG
jgi:hypothetical protein